MSVDRKFPNIAQLLSELSNGSKLDRELISTFQRIYDYIDYKEAELSNQIIEQKSQQQVSTKRLSELVNGFATDLAGIKNAQNPLSTLAQSPGTGTVTSVTINAGTNLTGGGTGTSIVNVTLNVSSNPVFTTTVINGIKIRAGIGSPETVEIGSPGDIYLDKNGGANITIYIKESGVATNVGWTAK